MIETPVELRDPVDLLLNCTLRYSGNRFREPQRPFRQVVTATCENTEQFRVSRPILTKLRPCFNDKAWMAT